MVSGLDIGLSVAIVHLAVFFSLLLGIRRPSRDQEEKDNPLFRCWETGTCQVVVIALSSRPSREPAYIVERMVELT